MWFVHLQGKCAEVIQTSNACQARRQLRTPSLPRSPYDWKPTTSASHWNTCRQFSTSNAIPSAIYLKEHMSPADYARHRGLCTEHACIFSSGHGRRTSTQSNSTLQPHPEHRAGRFSPGGGAGVANLGSARRTAELKEKGSGQERPADDQVRGLQLCAPKHQACALRHLQSLLRSDLRGTRQIRGFLHRAQERQSVHAAHWSISEGDTWLCSRQQLQTAGRQRSTNFWEE